ncbi:YlxR family protein [Cellulomonas triticagri]|uniref:YlxR family protein n=1 Tax=Cellulomonas triticagri TaxID=2483352 RepID=A0A3M2IR65_9CELL|nr:YlxR family protein [Cellulomonas triticagri]
MSARARLHAAGPDARLSSPSRRHPRPPAADTAAEVVVGPVRTCVGCRNAGPRSVLLRVVAATTDAGDPAVVVDVRRALPGRGAWLHPDPRCLELAERRRAFPRALRLAGPLDTSAVREHLGDD